MLEEGIDAGTTPNGRLDPAEIGKAFVLALDVVTQATASQLLHLLYDAHGTTKAVLNAATAAVVERYVYSAYGIDLALAATPATALRYAGEFIDPISGLSFNRARWYETSSGRWNRLDPFDGNLFSPVSLNTYQYVHGNPITGIDPSGEFFTYAQVHAAAKISAILGALVGATLGGVRGYIKNGWTGAFWGATLGAVTGAFFGYAGTTVVMLGGAWWAAAYGVPLWQGMMTVGILISIPERLLSAAFLAEAISRGDPVDITYASLGIVLSYLAFVPALYGVGKGTLSGTPARPHPNASADEVRSLTRQNESASLLARTYGLNVEQNPPTSPFGTNPDYRIFGHYADAYAPTTGRLSRIRDTLVDKVPRQGTRIVVNLDDSPLNPSEVIRYVDANRVPHLEELVLIKDGKVAFKLFE